MPLELYLAEDGSIFKRNPFRRDATFFTYSRLTDEELMHVRNLLRTNNARRKCKASSFGRAREPAIDGRARTDTDTNGGDYLH